MLPLMTLIKEKDPKHTSPQSSSITHLFPTVGSPILLGLALPCDLSGWCRWRAVALSALFFVLREVCQTLSDKARLSNLLVRDLGPGWLKQWECPCRIFLWAWKSCCQREGNGRYAEVSQKLQSNHPQNLYSVNLRHGFHCYLYLRTVDGETYSVEYLCVFYLLDLKEETTTVESFFVLMQIWASCLTG